MPQTVHDAIPPDLRGLAAVTHLSGLAGYVVPFGGILVPIIIWVVKRDTPVIARIARQAIFLNLAAFLGVLLGVVLFVTVILLPVALLLWAVLAVVVIALPVVGAIKATEGTYYRYPLVGSF